MMKISFPSFKEKVEYFLTLDIGTEAIKALVFKQAPRKITILGASLRYFDKFGVFDSKDFEIDVLKKTISKAIEEVREQSQVKTNFTLLGLPPNILRGKIIFQSFERNQPKEIINEKEEEEIYQTILKESQKKFSQIFASETGILPGEIQFIETKILETKIDGYEVSAIKGFDGRKLDFKILAIFLPRYYFENFEKIIKDFNFKISKIIHPAQNLTNIFEKSNAIFLDIGGEVSQVFLVNNGKLEMVETFNFGGRIFSQILSQSFGLSEQRARALKERLRPTHHPNNKISEEVRKKIKEIFNESLQAWFKELKFKLKEAKTLLPSTIFLFGGGSQLPEIQEILNEGHWENLAFVTPPQAKLVLPKDFKNIKNETKKLNNPQGIPPLLLCHYG